MSIVIFGGEQYYTPKKEKLKALIKPVHEKFLGDGALYLWNPSVQESDRLIQNLVNALYNLQAWFPKLLKKAQRELPVIELPRTIRFGLSRGTIYQLTRVDGTKEYIGICINLASRLQRYCPELNFLASARINVSEAYLNKRKYRRVVAKAIPGFPREVVIVDEDAFKKLHTETRESLFDEL
jgi:class 3 adenylate cyclase